MECFQDSNTIVRPNFFIVGAPKAGTTSLYHYLDQHPRIYMSPVKEPNYFAFEVRPERFSEEFQEQVRRDIEAFREYLAGPMSEKRFGGLVLEWADYLKLFQNVRDEKAIGEASVCYLWSETAAGNIRSKIGEARIIMILRDPAERAFSQYRQGVTKGVIRESFRERVDKTLKGEGDQFDRLHPFLELGFYFGQVKRFLDLFCRQNIYIAFYEDYQRDPAGMIENVLRFLDVDASFRADTSRKYLASGDPGCRMDARDRAYLVNYYRADIEKLAALLDRDLSHWLQ